MKFESRILLDMATLAGVEGKEVSARNLRESYAYIVKLEERLEIYSAPNTEGEVVYLGVGDTDGIACRDNTIRILDRQVSELEEGGCRYNCRTGVSMWKAGGRYVYDHWDKLARPADVHLAQMYTQWRKENE